MKWIIYAGWFPVGYVLLSLIIKVIAFYLFMEALGWPSY